MRGILDLPDHSLGISLERTGDHDEADKLEVAFQGLPLDLPGLWTNMGGSHNCDLSLPNFPGSNGVLGGEGLEVPDNGQVVPATSGTSVSRCGHGTLSQKPCVLASVSNSALLTTQHVLTLCLIPETKNAHPHEVCLLGQACNKYNCRIRVLSAMRQMKAEEQGRQGQGWC